MGPAGSVAAFKPTDDAGAAGTETPAGTAATDGVETESATQAPPKPASKPAASQRRAPVQPEMDSLPFDDDAVSIEPGNRVDLRGKDK